MLRGVSKNIIEVIETENQYFEKAILFVRPSHKEKESSFLSERAKEYITRADMKYGISQNLRGFSLWIKLGISALIGSAATALAMLIF